MFMGFKEIFSKYLVFYNVGGWESHAEVLFKFLLINNSTVWIFTFGLISTGTTWSRGDFQEVV